MTQTDCLNDLEKKGNSIDLQYIGRDISSAIKGIAILMMFVHHFFTFPHYWISGIEYPLLEKISPIINQPLRLCVSIFTFITGYVYYFASNKTYRYSAKKLRNFLIQYWGAFLLIGLIDAIIGGYKFTIKDILLELIALKRPIMIFCWYVYFYVFSLLIMPLVALWLKKTGTSKKSFFIDLFIVIIVVPAFFMLLRHYLPLILNSERYGFIVANFMFFICNISGFVCAKHDLYRKLDDFSKKIIRSRKVSVIIWVALLLIVPFGRYFQSNLSVRYEFDYLLSFVFVYCSTNLLMMVRETYFCRIIGVLGRYSLQMWFVSCFFFNACKEKFQMILYWPHNPLFVLLWGTVICLAVSVLLDKICKRIISGCDSLIRL